MKMLLTCFSMLFLLSTASSAVAQTVPQPVGTAGAAKGAADSSVKAANVSVDYRLVPGDKLRIEVYKDTQLSQNVQIRPDGKITLPLANDVTAAGRTPTELRDAIVSSLRTYMSSPTVTVMVVETVPQVVFVMGEVNKAGPQPLTGKLDVVQALAMAGGFKDFANTKDIKIRRGTQIMTFNYNDALKGKAAPLYLQPGDTIVVR
jgi:polysaccharide biosynthesis/export protein